MSVTTSIKKILPGKLKIFLRIMYTTRNWWDVLFLRLGLKKDCIAVLRKGYRVPLDGSWRQWKLFMSYVDLLRENSEAEVIGGNKVKIRYRGRELFFNVGKFGVNMPFDDIFLREPYKKFVEEFDIRDRVVIDIGANLGDTAIYFALWGARHVYAYEAFPGQGRLAQENVKLNGLGDKCDVFIAAVGGKSGIFTEDPNFYLFASDPNINLLLEGMEPGEKIHILTLKEIVDRLGIDHAFLKIDCEGYEYDIVLNASTETLKRFDYIVVEYHYGFEDLKKKFLEAGFVVKYTEPEHSPPPYTFPKDSREWDVGYIVASRN